MYYNQITKKKMSRQDLKNLINCSIPANQESIGDWLLIHDEIPERQDGKILMKDYIDVRDGVAIQVYKYIDIPDDSNDEEDRISILENAVMELAQIISNIEYDRLASENSAAGE